MELSRSIENATDILNKIQERSAKAWSSALLLDLITTDTNYFLKKL